MAVKSKDEIMQMISDKFKDQTDDATLELIGDISDTINGYENKIKTSGDWEKKYAENDKAWREKYKERFFSGEPIPEPEPDPETEEKKPKSFEDLFTIEKEK